MLKAFQITEEYQERYGYPTLTRELKAKILGLNGAALYEVDPTDAPCEFTVRELEQIRRQLPGNEHGARSPDLGPGHRVPRRRSRAVGRDGPAPVLRWPPTHGSRTRSMGRGSATGTTAARACPSRSWADSSTRSRWSSERPSSVPSLATSSASSGSIIGGTGGATRRTTRRRTPRILRVADVLAVLDAIEVARAAILGISWGGRLGFGVVDRAPGRVRSLVSIGQHPYRLRDDGPLGRILSAAMEASRTQGISALVEAFEGLAGRYPDEIRAAYLAEDAVAMRAAWTAGLAEGPVADHLGSWDLPCCICVAAGDVDFADDARRAAAEIPGARFVVIEGIDHLGVDTVEADPFLQAVVDTLRADRGA